MTASHELVSVILPVRNERETIGPVLEDLLAQKGEFYLEIIVADGGSTDGTRDRVREIATRDPRVREIPNLRMVIPHGLNVAIQAARGDIILRMDGHARPEPGYVARCLEVMAVTGAWNVGGVMAKQGDTAAGRAASAAATSAFGIGGGRGRFHLKDSPGWVDSVWLGCWPRWVFERIGLFDPEMEADQDEELNQRILDAGGGIYFDPGIRAAYRSRATWRGLFRQYFRYAFYKNRAVQKRPRLLRWRHLAPAVLIAILIGGIVLGLVWREAWVLVALALGGWLVAAVGSARRVAPAYGSSTTDVMCAFATIHAAYGLGTWTGMARFGHRWFMDRRGSVPLLPT